MNTPHSSRPTRVLVLAEAGFDGRAVDEILRREHREVRLEPGRESVVERIATEQIDVLILCSHRSGRRTMDLINRITSAQPTLPVIIVTSPAVGTAARSLDAMDSPATAAPVDAGSLLRLVQEALTGPKIKRLIRLTDHRGSPRFVARNTRWLADDLQARYSMPFHWTAPEVAVPPRIGSADATHP